MSEKKELSLEELENVNGGAVYVGIEDDLNNYEFYTGAVLESINAGLSVTYFEFLSGQMKIVKVGTGVIKKTNRSSGQLEVTVEVNGVTKVGKPTITCNIGPANQ